MGRFPAFRLDCETVAYGGRLIQIRNLSLFREGKKFVA